MTIESTATTTHDSKHDKPIKRPRGFAAMSPERRAQISRLGGKAAHERGTAHQFNPDEAREAGRKGGKAYHKVRGRVTRVATPAHAES